MARRSHSSILRSVLTIAALFTIFATPAWSEESQLRAGDSAGDSFDRFARTWLDSVHDLSVPAHPAIMIDDESASGVVTIRKYGNEFTTELRATGREGAEYVGILHYSESVYNCRENNIENCSEPSTVPVTEIFRYDNGRWIY